MKLLKKSLTVVVALAFLAPLSVAPAYAVDFGNNSSQWAYDGECDDPRFVGAGMDEILLDEDAYADAADCQALYQKGIIQLRGSNTKSSGGNFGDNASQWAYDGECDDPRFTGPGVDEILLDEDRGHDAADCQALYNTGRIRWK